MRKSLLLGSLLAALAMFAWGTVFWMTPLGEATVARTLDPGRAHDTLRDLFPADGAYFFPDFPEGSSQEDWAERHRRGPLGLVLIRHAGAQPMGPMTFVNGFLHMRITCVLIAWLLGRAAPALGSYQARVGFVLLAGFAATFWGQAGDSIWFYGPWRYHLMGMLYDLVAWTLAGIVLARFARAE